MKILNNKNQFILLLVFLFFVSPISAHPGNTAADGCHYCRTNCDKWGEDWNERHCHGGGSAPETIYTAPTNTYIPLPTSTPRPTNTLIPTKSPTLTITITPTITPTQTVTLTPTPTKKITITSTQNSEKVTTDGGFWTWIHNFLKF